MSNQFEPATRDAIKDLLEQLPFVSWDRFTTRHDYRGDRYINIYGWIPRDDDYKDFVLLRFWPELGDDGIIGFTTSSDHYTHEIHKRLFGEESDGHNDCQRVEHTFDVSNAIELDPDQTTLTDGGVRNSSSGTERSEKRERAFKHDFARAMWDSLPDDSKERLRGGRSR